MFKKMEATIDCRVTSVPYTLLIMLRLPLTDGGVCVYVAGGAHERLQSVGSARETVHF